MRNDECLILASGETASLRPCCANKVINPCASTLSLAANRLRGARQHDRRVRPRGLSGAVSHFQLDDIPRQSSGAIYEKDLGWRTTDIALK
jgi:hypothetical protein